MHTSSATTKARKVFLRCALWEGAPAEAIERLFDASVVEFHNNGSVALAEDAISQFIVVVSGRVRASGQDARGHEISYARAVCGEQLGALAAIHDRPLGSSFVATEPSVVVKVPAAALRELMRSESTVSYHMALHFSERFLNLLETFSLQHADVHCRLAGHLLGHARIEAGEGPIAESIDLGMSRRELASVLGTVPETLSRAFGRLRDEGLIATEGRRVVKLLDIDGLEAIAP